MLTTVMLTRGQERLTFHLELEKVPSVFSVVASRNPRSNGGQSPWSTRWPGESVGGVRVMMSPQQSLMTSLRLTVRLVPALVLPLLSFQMRILYQTVDNPGTCERQPLAGQLPAPSAQNTGHPYRLAVAAAASFHATTPAHPHPHPPLRA